MRARTVARTGVLRVRTGEAGLAASRAGNESWWKAIEVQLWTGKTQLWKSGSQKSEERDGGGKMAVLRIESGFPVTKKLELTFEPHLSPASNAATLMKTAKGIFNRLRGEVTTFHGFQTGRFPRCLVTIGPSIFRGASVWVGGAVIGGQTGKKAKKNIGIFFRFRTRRRHRTRVRGGRRVREFFTPPARSREKRSDAQKMPGVGDASKRVDRAGALANARKEPSPRRHHANDTIARVGIDIG